MGSYYGNFVIPETLATPADYTTWTTLTPPANITPILRSCTSLVLNATEGAYYATDPLTGLAIEVQMLNAMRDATCIQAAAWVALGIDPLTGGVVVSSVKTSKKLATASVTYADSAEAAAARSAAYENLVPEALRKLQQTNLVGSGPWTFG
jgi:hypothetical protein